MKVVRYAGTMVCLFNVIISSLISTVYPISIFGESHQGRRVAKALLAFAIDPLPLYNVMGGGGVKGGTKLNGEFTT